ncbi:MAG: hypothetical protein ACP5XB_23730 [Isosphaeraceae bacterium]
MMNHLDEETANENRPESILSHPQACSNASGSVVSISAEAQVQDAKAVADFVERMLALPDEDPPGAWEEAMRDLDEHRPFRRLFEGLL